MVQALGLYFYIRSTSVPPKVTAFEFCQRFKLKTLVHVICRPIQKQSVQENQCFHVAKSTNHILQFILIDIVILELGFVLGIETKMKLVWPLQRERHPKGKLNDGHDKL